MSLPTYNDRENWLQTSPDIQNKMVPMLAEIADGIYAEAPGPGHTKRVLLANYLIHGGTLVKWQDWARQCLNKTTGKVDDASNDAAWKTCALTYVDHFAGVDGSEED